MFWDKRTVHSPKATTIYWPTHEHVVKVKVKIQPRTGHEGSEMDYSYSWKFYLTSTLDGCGWSTPRPGRFTAWVRDPVPTVQEVEWVAGQVWRVEENLLRTSVDPRTVQPLQSRCNIFLDWGDEQQRWLIAYRSGLRKFLCAAGNCGKIWSVTEQN